MAVDPNARSTHYEYGAAPQEVGRVHLPGWREYMHYLYLPVVMRGWDPGDVLVKGHIRLPANLEFLREPVEWVCEWEGVVDDDGVAQSYVYVTARRGYAAPGNPLNRPGWHADGFGSDDINYIWSDRWPTRFAVGRFHDISDDHVESARQFEEQILAPHREASAIVVRDGVPEMLYRLDPSMIHSTPIIDPPGGTRSFFKISVSPDRYNLDGNSHNHLFDYEWKMWSREEVRNHPTYAGGDAGPQEDS